MAINNTLPLTKVDYPRIALILVEALFYGDKKTAKRWGITNRTIVNYRDRLDGNEELSNLFNEKRVEFEGNWAIDIPSAVRAGIRYLLDAPAHLPYTAENIYAVSGAVKILAEVGLTKEIIDARLSGYDPGDRTQGESIPAYAPETD